MTPTQFRTKLAALNLSQVGAAKALGIDPRTVRRYARGDLRVTQLVELALEGLKERSRDFRSALSTARPKAGGWSAGQIERAWRSRHAFMTSGATSEMGWEDGERAGMAVALDSISGPPPTAAEIEEKD